MFCRAGETVNVAAYHSFKSHIKYGFVQEHGETPSSQMSPEHQVIQWSLVFPLQKVPTQHYVEFCPYTLTRVHLHSSEVVLIYTQRLGVLFNIKTLPSASVI